MAVSDGLSTIWGFCHLGGHYFKNWRMLYCMELNSIQPSTKIYVKIKLRFLEFVSVLCGTFHDITLVVYDVINVR